MKTSPADQQASFSPIFPRSGGQAFGRKQSFVHRAVNTLPVPCNGFHLVILGQSGSPQMKEKA
jgi:hypothetical protein